MHVRMSISDSDDPLTDVRVIKDMIDVLRDHGFSPLDVDMRCVDGRSKACFSTVADGDGATAVTVEDHGSEMRVIVSYVSGKDTVIMPARDDMDDADHLACCLDAYEVGTAHARKPYGIETHVVMGRSAMTVCGNGAYLITDELPIIASINPST